MNTLELSNASLVELTNDELVDIEGGLAFWVAAVVVVVLLHSCAGDSDLN